MSAISSKHNRPFRRRELSLAVLLSLGLFSGIDSALAQNGTAAASEGDSSGKSIDIPHLQSEPELDGILDDVQWAQATLVDDFHQMNPVEYATPSQRTEVKVFYTDDALFVSAHMYETDPAEITARILRQGQGLGPDDIFVLMLDPYLDGRSGYEFEINPYSIREEGLFKNVSSIDRTWLGIWQAKSRIDEEGWAVEIRIPFQTISFNPNSDTWGINFRRAIRRNSETIGWVSRNRQMNPSIAGTAHGFEGLRQGLGLDVVPYLLMRQDRIFATPGSKDNSIEPQLDIFYKITPQLNAALTLNTDFSATEVDDRQVNLTRFNLFFPERRDFFLRDVDIFEFGQIGTGGNAAVPGSATQNGRPFFSRRIGLSPNGAAVDIDVGAKLSGRIGNWNVGSLIVRQGEDDLSGLDAREVFVGRAALNVLSESQVGMIVTNGNPQADFDNSVLGVDFNYRNSRLAGGRVVQAKTWYQQSDSENLSGDDSAYGIGISFPNNTGWQGAYNFKRVEANFNPALGFVNLTNMQDHALDFGYWHYLPRGNYVRSVYGSFDGYRLEDLATGDLISENFGPKLWLENNTSDNGSLRFARNREVLASDFTIYRGSDGHNNVVIPAGDYVFYDTELNLDSGTQRALSGGITLRAGEYYDGNRFQRQMNLNWRPALGYQFGLNYTENEIHLSGGHFTVRQTNLTSQISFSSTLTWSNRIQYDNVSELFGFNSRLHWIPEAGRQAFLVLNYGLIDPDKDNTFESVNWDLSLKFNYTFRF